VRHRYGAIGRSGPIALIERFFRTLKALAQTRERPPLLKADLERRLATTFDYYVWLRPHQGLEGRTSAEVFLGRRPAHLDAVPPPRGRPGQGVEFTTGFEVHYLDREQRLPFLVRKAASSRLSSTDPVVEGGPPCASMPPGTGFTSAEVSVNPPLQLPLRRYTYYQPGVQRVSTRSSPCRRNEASTPPPVSPIVSARDSV
jgi:hypothetical protein